LFNLIRNTCWRKSKKRTRGKRTGGKRSGSGRTEDGPKFFQFCLMIYSQKNILGLGPDWTLNSRDGANSTSGTRRIL
jgi:hypothetical protein